MRQIATTTALVLLLTLSSCCESLLAQSRWIELAPNGRLIYTPDAEGDQLPDFSDVGYRYGREEFPFLQATVTLSPVEGVDNTPMIQAAIDQVAALPVQANGFRGAVRLLAGTFRIDGTLKISHSGISIRGAGYGQGGTRLQATGTDRRNVIEIEGSGEKDFFGSRRNVVDKVVPVGARSFRVNKPADFAVGDRVRVSRPGWSGWFTELGMDDPDIDWATSDNYIRFDRTITRIEGDRLFVDAPLTNALELEWALTRVQKYTWPGRIQNIGIDNIAIWSSWTSFEDEDHPWTAIFIDKAEHVRISRFNCLFFARSAVRTGTGAKNVTLWCGRNAKPRSAVEGGRRYAFEFNGQLELGERLRSFDGRHDFVVNEQRAPGPHVFTFCNAFDALSESGPHQRWTNGTLFDRVTVQGNTLAARNRGTFGSGQGWSGANNVFFNCVADGFMIQNPPTAQNWLIGSSGPIIEDDTFGPQPPGNYDAHGRWVPRIQSLYRFQRLEVADLADGRRVDQRDYLFGDIDQFHYDGTSSEDEWPISPEWANLISSTSSLPVSGFDSSLSNRNFAATLNYRMDPDEEVIHGWLSLALKKTSDDLDTDFVRLFNDNAIFKLSLDDLGWRQQLKTGDTFVGVIYLGRWLHRLQDGEINIQVSDDIAVDWAKLNITVAVDP